MSNIQIDDDNITRNTVTLDSRTEWRFEVSSSAKLNVWLIEGNAELFGTELARGREYEFSGQKSAIFTYHGCKLEWNGECNEYTSANPTMLRYANIHFSLENMRTNSLNSNSDPPRTLILGPRNSGKTTLAKILVSYASKMGFFPVLVNLDPSNPVFGPPGSVSATPISHILDIEDVSGQPPINGPALVHHKQSLVYDYGLPDYKTSPKFYLNQIQLLSKGLERRIESDDRVRASGLIVDTPSNLSVIEENDNLETVRQIVNDYKINNILVINKEKLASVLERAVDCLVVNIPQCGGVVENDEHFVRSVQRVSISTYFFGNSRQGLSPFTTSVNLNDVVVYRPLEENEYNAVDDTLLTKVTPSAVLQNSVLAVVNADLTADINTVSKAETLGYVYVVEADERKHILKILLPVPGKLPQKPLIMGSFKYHE